MKKDNLRRLFTDQKTDRERRSGDVVVSNKLTNASETVESSKKNWGSPARHWERGELARGILSPAAMDQGLLEFRDRIFLITPFCFMTATSTEARSVPPAVSNLRHRPFLPKANLATEGWISLFSGTNLDDWTIKIAKRSLGENFANTFRVEEAVIKVGYTNSAISLGY